MNSDSGLEKDVLSYDNSNFSFKMNKKINKLKKPNPPLCTFFFYFFPYKVQPIFQIIDEQN